MPWNEDDKTHGSYEHPVASHFGGPGSDMKLTYMSQKSSTTMPKGRKERSPIGNPLIAPPLQATDRAGMLSVDGIRRMGKGDALVLHFRKEANGNFVYDVSSNARIVVYQLKRLKGWMAKLQTRTRLQVIPEHVSVLVTPAHIETRYLNIDGVMKEQQRFIPKQVSERLIPEQRLGGIWEDAFHGNAGVHPIVAIRSLAHQADWLYVQGDRRSLIWWYRSLIILGVTKGDTMPKKRFTTRIQPVPQATWIWELVPAHHVPSAVLPDNTGMVRTPKMPSIRGEMSLHANGDYDDKGTIDGKLKKSKRTKAFKYEPADKKNRKIRKIYASKEGQ